MKAIVLKADWQPRAGYPVTQLEIDSQKATMASQVWRNPRYAEAVIDDPTPSPREVVVKVRACGVCGSDTHCYETDDEGYIEGTAIVLRHDESGTELRLVVGGAAYLTGIRKGQPAEIALILDICEKPKEGSVAPM